MMPASITLGAHTLIVSLAIKVIRFAPGLVVVSVVSMKLRILSDLHIEVHPFEIPHTAHDAESVLILAGDIGTIRRYAELDAFLRRAAEQFRAVVYVLGNHEFYRSAWPDAMHELLTWNLPTNIHVLERRCVEIGGIVFAGTTLWTDFDGQDRTVMSDAQRLLSDYHYIHAPGTEGHEAVFLEPDHVLQDHLQSRAWLDTTLAALRAEGKRSVVVTHHAISHKSIHESYRGDPLNGAFVNDCDGLFEKHRPELVIHGHVHNSFDYCLSTEPGATRVVANPRGYTRRDDTQENPLFDPYYTIDLGA